MFELYQSEECPSCAEVRKRLTELGISYVIHNPRLPRTKDYETKNEVMHAHLRKLAGEDRIPFLVDTAREETLLGPNAILEYLEETYSASDRSR